MPLPKVLQQNSKLGIVFNYFEEPIRGLTYFDKNLIALARRTKSLEVDYHEPSTEV
jgi:hypothetical protein